MISRFCRRLGHICRFRFSFEDFKRKNVNRCSQKNSPTPKVLCTLRFIVFMGCVRLVVVRLGGHLCYKVFVPHSFGIRSLADNFATLIAARSGHPLCSFLASGSALHSLPSPSLVFHSVWAHCALHTCCPSLVPRSVPHLFRAHRPYYMARMLYCGQAFGTRSCLSRPSLACSVSVLKDNTSTKLHGCPSRSQGFACN